MTKLLLSAVGLCVVVPMSMRPSTVRQIPLTPHGIERHSNETRRAAMLDVLVGGWDGEGELFGQPSRFSMEWNPELGGRFLGLSYEITGNVRMNALAHYRVAEDTLRGVWVDSRGEILELTAVATDSTLETMWQSTSEQGRTMYRVAGPDSLVVRDFVRDGSGWRHFGTAHYTRR